ncbi:MAG: DUF5615 family PIN-like protein [bacterium]
MKFKLDENFGKRTQHLFKASGHETQTVREEGLQGSPDQTLFRHCLREQRCLVTLDLDFTDVTRFPPQQTAGIAVVRIPQNPSLPVLENLVQQLLHMLTLSSIDGQLWIIEAGRIRIYQKDPS